MIVLPEHLLGLSHIDDVTVSGRGEGTAHLISVTRMAAGKFFSLRLRKKYNGKMWRLEIKKQQNLQWFDSGKYYLLNGQNRDIVLLLVNHVQGNVDTLAAVHLGCFIDLLMSRPQYQALGWTEEVMSVAAEFNIKYCSLQFEAKAEIMKIMRAHPDLFQILYQRHKIDAI